MLHVVFVLVLWLINLVGMQLFVGWIITLPLSAGFMMLMFEEVKITGHSDDTAQEKVMEPQTTTESTQVKPDK
jgi:hypothetical protein